MDGTQIGNTNRTGSAFYKEALAYLEVLL